MTDSNKSSDSRRKSKAPKEAGKASPATAISDFVSEQPGLGLSFLGLFLAFFMGLSVRAITAPDRIHGLVQKAAENIHRDVHKDTQIKFKKAYVSLARGLFPDLSVIIEDIEIESQKTCWFSPVAEIHRILAPSGLLVFSSHNRGYVPRVGLPVQLLIGDPRRPVRKDARLDRWAPYSTAE